MRVEANLSGTFTVTAQFSLQKHKKKNVDLENEGQIDEAQHPQLCHSMGSLKIYERHTLAIHHLRDIIITIFYAEKLSQGQGREVQHS